MNNIRKIGIIGSGIIGEIIASIAALNFYDVVIVDDSQENLDKIIKKISMNFSKIISKEEIDRYLKNIKISTNYNEIKDCDMVLEALADDYKIKTKIFREISNYLNNAIIATTTSMLSIDELAKEVYKRDKFIGLHFISEQSPIIEVILGKETSSETLNKTIEFIRRIHKDYVLIKRDIPGFLINRILAKIFLESIIMLDDGYKKEDIDAMIRFRLKFPMGIFELMDYIGVDYIYNILNEMVKREENIYIPNTLNSMILKNKIGFRVGEGFYAYPDKVYKKQSLIPNDSMYKINPARLISVAVNESSRMIKNDITSKEDIEKAMTLGLNWPYGPLHYADYFGLNNIIEMLNKRYEETGYEMYKPDQYLLELSKKGIGVKSGKGFFEYMYKNEKLGPVSYELIDNHAEIIINRPEKLNALNEEVWRNVRIFLEKAEKDPEVRSVVLRGEGNAFSAGDDIEMMSKWNGYEAKKWSEDLAWPLFNLMMNYTKPLIAAINGYAFGGGMELTLLADIVISTENSIFSIPEVLIGALPPIASPIGMYIANRRIIRYALTGDWINSEEAKQMGIVDIVVPRDQLDIVISEVTDKLSILSPVSIRAIKNSINSSKSIFLSSIRNSLNELVLLANSKDFAEGMKAFLEKRKPNFKGE